MNALERFVVTTSQGYHLFRGVITDNKFIIEWRADIGLCPPTEVVSKHFKLIAPTASIINRYSNNGNNSANRLWTGGHRSSRTLSQQSVIPTPNEMLDILDCSD